MQLDLSNKGILSIEDSILIDKVALQVQQEYNKIIEQLITDNSLSDLDLLLSIVSRNPYTSSVLPILCKIMLLEEKLKKGDKISLIIVENKLVVETIISVLKKYNQTIPIQVIKRFTGIFWIFICLVNFIKSIYLIIVHWLWPRLTLTYRIEPKESVLLVDNFILPSSFTIDNVFIERHYTGYEKYLSKSQKKKIWYAPTLIGFKSLIQLLKMSSQAKKSNNNFIFQESWLTFCDYIYSLYLAAILPYKFKVTRLFMGHNINRLLISEARKDFCSPALTMAICKYRFIINLKKANINICQVIDWHENQIIDKALNLALHKYYPDVEVKGYQGYVSSPHEAHKIPRLYELENGSLPDQLHVISDTYKNTVLNSCPDLDVRVSSAFRFSYLYDIDRSKLITDIPIILIALPMNIDDSISILNTCIQLQSLIYKKVEILVKHHPGYDSKEFAKKVPEFLNDSFKVTHDNMCTLLELISLLISSASSVCAEASSIGIPVAIYGNRQGVTLNPILDDISNFKNNIFYSEDQLGDFVNKSLGKSNYKSSIEQSFFMDNGESAKDLFVCN